MMRMIWPFFLLLVTVFFTSEALADKPQTKVFFSLKLVNYTNYEGKVASGQCCDEKSTKRCTAANTCDVLITRCAGVSETKCDVFPGTAFPIMSNTNFINASGPTLKGLNGKEQPTMMSFNIDFPPSPINVKVKVYDVDYDTTEKIAFWGFQVKSVLPYFQDNPIPWEKKLLKSQVAEVGIWAVAMCQEHYYGPDCSTYCNADGIDTQECSREGSLECHKGWKGDKCDTCDQYYYGDKCDVYCKPNATYTCSDEGIKQCKTGWTGDKCDTCDQYFYGDKCSTFCKPTNRYNCSDSGMKDCLENYHGDNCSYLCDDSTQRYTCQLDGSRHCKEGWSGRLCDNDFITCQVDQSFKTGVFNQVIIVWLKSYTNYNGTLANGKCCDNKDAQACPSNQCDTSLYVNALRGDDAEDCFNFPTQYYPPTSNKDSFSVFGQDEKEKDPPLALTSYVLPFSNKPTKFKVTAYDEDESPQWSEDIATWNFQVDWLDQAYLGNSPKWRKLTLRSPTAELTVWVSSMCSRNFYGESCSKHCETSGQGSCGSDGKETPKSQSLTG